MHANDSCNYFAMCSNSRSSKLAPLPPLRNRSKQPMSRTHLLTISTPQRWRTALRVNKGCWQDISDRPYSTATDKAAALCVVITSSLDWEFLSEWRRFVLWLTSLLVSVVTSLLFAGQRSASRRQGWEVEAMPETSVGRVESCQHCCICWWSLVKVRRSFLVIFSVKSPFFLKMLNNFTNLISKAFSGSSGNKVCVPLCEKNDNLIK